MALGMMLYSFGWIGCIMPARGVGGGAAGLSLVLCHALEQVGIDIQIGTMVFFLNAKNYLIKEEILGLGTTDQVNVFPNKIAKHALMNDAKAVVLCHNHPSGVVTPSIDDTQTTYTVKRILKPLDIILLDHIIVSKFAYYSYREEDAHKPAAYKQILNFIHYALTVSDTGQLQQTRQTQILLSFRKSPAAYRATTREKQFI